MPHDYTQQKADTYATFSDIRDSVDALPDSADIDYAFVPGAHADWDAAQSDLTEQGYACTRVEPDPDFPDDSPYLEAVLPDQPLSAGAIWLGEEIATAIALRHGFAPDGWGFSA